VSNVDSFLASSLMVT